MKTMIDSKRTGTRGVALLYAVFAAFLAASFIAATMAAASVAHRYAQVKRYDAEAQYLAEGAVEAGKKQLQVAVANWGSTPTTGSVQINGHTATYTVTPTGFTTVNTDPSGIQTIVTGYELDANASIGGARANSHRILNIWATPLFQYAVFYDSDLEILPGPNMTIHGRVHSNQDLYLASNNTLKFDTNYLHAVGDIYRHRKDDPASSPGTVQIRNWVANPFNPTEPSQYFMMGSQSQMAALGVTTQSGYDSLFTAGYDANHNGIYTDAGDWLPFAPGALAYWAQPNGYPGIGHTVMSGDHGVSAAVPPGIGSTAMYEPTAGGTGGDYNWSASLGQYVQVAPGTGAYSEGYYHSQADLSILTFANGSWKAYDNTGLNISSALASAVSVTTMYDARQAHGGSGVIHVTKINLGALAATGWFPANGLLYAANYGEGTGLNAAGIQLTNGSHLPSHLTVATPDPLYIWGNYNTVAQQPAAVICDALNLLSNAWNNSKAPGTLPGATNTTYNVAVVAGNTETTVGHYNGGLENLPRFHENWSGKTATIKGSFVKPWNSQYASAAWVYGGGYYQAPNRDWSYNTAFNNVANLPPFTPMGVTADDIVTW